MSGRQSDPLSGHGQFDPFSSAAHPDGALRTLYDGDAEGVSRQDEVWLPPRCRAACLEDQVVRYLLWRYGILDCRARHICLDLEQELLRVVHHVSGGNLPQHSRRLTFRAFRSLFPGYELELDVKILSKRDREKIKFDRPESLARSTPVCSFVRHLMMENRLEHPAIRIWYVSTNEVMVSGLPCLTTLHCRCTPPGVYATICSPRGWQLQLQRLDAALDVFDGLHAPEEWQQSATRPGWDEALNTMPPAGK